MTKEKAIETYEELTYDLAKAISKISDIKESMSYINDQMGWDGMFELDFENALVKLANVQAAAVVYIFESKFRERDIENYKSEVKALEESKDT